MQNTAELLAVLDVSTTDEVERILKTRGIGYHKGAMGELWPSNLAQVS